MKFLIRRMLIFLTLLMMIVSSSSFGQSADNSGRALRELKLRNLLDSVEGAAKESARVFKMKDGYLRFLGAPPSSHFTVEAGKRLSAEEAADSFLEKNRELFVSESADVGFDVIRVKSKETRTYARYQQTYAGLKVFGAEMIIQVDDSGGIAAVISDIMRNTEQLDCGDISLMPSVDSLLAEESAVEWMATEYEGLKFETLPANLMIFCPPVAGETGPTQLVWQTEVYNTGEPVAREFVLVNAHSGGVVFNYPLIYDAKDRHVCDYPTSECRDEGDPVSDIVDVNNCYDFLGATYDFYDTEHGRDSIDDSGMTIEATVRYSFCNAYWNGQSISLGNGLSFDDVIAHEYTHGVTQYESGLIYKNQSGAINESFSDMWGEWVDQGFTNGRDTDTTAVKWLMGEDVECTGGAIRDMADPTAFNDPDRLYGQYWYYGRSDNGGVHSNSGVGNKLCYLLTDGNAFNGYTISGMGVSKTADLMYECQTNLLTSCSDYYDFANLLMQGAINLGFTQAERDNVENACRAVEICGVSSFTVESSSSWPVARFTHTGHLVLGASLVENTTPTATSGDEFRIQDSNGTDVAIIDADYGNMYIKGSKNENHDMTLYGNHRFIVQDSNGDNVAYINELGDLYLKGSVHTYANP